MQIVRLGLTPVKGMTHVALPELTLTPDGPRGDREFCLVDPARGQVLRSAENQALMACSAAWEPPVLTIRTPLGEASGDVDDGASVTAGYWAREVELVTVDGPWSPLLSRYLGRPVLLCRAPVPGSVVWAGPVSLVSTSSLRELARRIEQPDDDGARFRATVVVDTGDAPPFVEDTWVGSKLGLGSAAITLDERLPRCAVVNYTPGRAAGRSNVLSALASDRHQDGEIYCGVTGDVVQPGVLSLGDQVRLL